MNIVFMFKKYPMKNLFLTIACLGTSFYLMAQKADVSSLREAELNRFKIMVAQDGAGLDKVLHKDLVYIHSSGTQDSKASYIESIVSQKTIYAIIEPEEFTQRVYGNIGINTGIVNVTNKKDGAFLPVNRLKFTDIYIFENGRWQMLSWQSLKINK
ncbi:nuclear transport factor 2 family protein [Aquirufa rosea]|uniref:Nuclear transport factor 2 family protein n=2 Tax=Aquirufa rosea TaxID=2509241 RepID=A0A4Q1BZZ4_9BACT|nr:nuclear transport factor 2 family protein [Aquirufa rosea]